MCWPCPTSLSSCCLLSCHSLLKSMLNLSSWWWDLVSSFGWHHFYLAMNTNTVSWSVVFSVEKILFHNIPDMTAVMPNGILGFFFFLWIILQSIIRLVRHQNLLNLTHDTLQALAASGCFTFLLFAEFCGSCHTGCHCWRLQRTPATDLLSQICSPPPNLCYHLSFLVPSGPSISNWGKWLRPLCTWYVRRTSSNFHACILIMPLSF